MTYIYTPRLYPRNANLTKSILHTNPQLDSCPLSPRARLQKPETHRQRVISSPHQVVTTVVFRILHEPTHKLEMPVLICRFRHHEHITRQTRRPLHRSRRFLDWRRTRRFLAPGAGSWRPWTERCYYTHSIGQSWYDERIGAITLLESVRVVENDGACLQHVGKNLHVPDCRGKRSICCRRSTGCAHRSYAP